jgi:wyosine [tRNA(Phe)-imidazoG37] synthetase (radical SAM superfamily)
METADLVFGPIPSRRLGQSLGINNTLQPKACSYNCAYCQVGRTHHFELSRRAFFAPEQLRDAVEARLAEAETQGIHIDYLSFVPDGEPTLDIRLGEAVALLRPFGKPVAVFSNASLIWRPDVRADLAMADWVSLKFDAVTEPAWRKIDRPHKSLQLPLLLEGALAFARQYRGELVTETMLCAGLNDHADELTATADFIARLQPAMAYLGVPTRPPVESWALPPDEPTLNMAYAIFAERLPKVELMISFPESAFQHSTDAARNLLAVTAVHPVREFEVLDYLQKSETDVQVLEQLLAEGALKRVEYAGQNFILRAL